MIDAQSLKRVADFFEGDYESAYRLAYDVWLPETVRTLERLAIAIEARSKRDVDFLCDHLREGARCVGASAYVDAANGIEYTYGSGGLARSLQLASDALAQTVNARAWLERRLNVFGSRGKVAAAA
jgi:hypothetical protein